MRYPRAYSKTLLTLVSSSFTKISAFLLCFSAVGLSQGQTPVTLNVGDTEQQMVRYGMDYERLWFWNGSNSNKRQVAQWSMVDCDLDYIRVAMNSEFELDRGEYNLDAYTKKIIPMMTEMKAAKPDIKFFASPRPLNEAVGNARWQPYPLWVTGASSYTDGNFDFDDIACAEYLLRYLRLMKSYGFKISFMDLTNEWQGNSGGRLTQNDARDIVEYMKEYVVNRPDPDPSDSVDPDLVLPTLVPDDLPLFVGPSSWEFSQGASWIRGLNDSRKRNAIDIASSHNTNRDSGSGTEQSFADQARETLGDDIEIWQTELHGWKSTSNEDEATSSYFFFDAIRAGFTGINGWLAIGTPNQGHSYILNQGGTVTRNVKYFIFRKITTTSNYGHALDVNVPSQLQTTTALIKGNLLTVWAVNTSSSDVPVQVNLGNRTNPSGQVISTRWSEAINVAGAAQPISMTPGGNSFSATVVANSVHCFEIPLVDLIPSQDVMTATAQDTPASVVLTSGGDDTGLSFSVVTDPTNGTLSGAAPEVIYTPNPGFLGTDTFNFVFSNGTATSTLATATVNVSARQLVANWKLDETSGTVVVDSTGNGHNGTLVSGTWMPTSGQTGGAIDFNAGNDEITLPSSAFDTISSEITLSMWVFGDTTQPRQDTIFYGTNSGGDRLANVHLPWEGGTVFWDAGNSSGYDRISKTAEDPTTYRGQWNLWSFTKDSSGNMNIYLNGNPTPFQSGTNKNRLIADVTRVFLGSDGSSRHYDGMVDDVRLYNFALTGSQVQGLYNGYINNQVPVAANGAVSVLQGRTALLDIPGSDPDGGDVIYIIQDPPQNGTLSGAGSSWSYTPDPSFVGADSFTYTVSDTFAESSEATVFVNVNSGIVAHWPMDEGSGEILRDISGNGYHGTLVAGTWTDGVIGGALNFAVNGQRANLPVEPFNSLSDEISISVWAKGGDSHPHESVLFYGSRNPNSGGGRIINAHVPWSDSTVFWDASDRLKDSPTISEDEMKGRWNHWLFTKNASQDEMAVYLNGTLLHSGRGSASLEDIGSFTLGAQGTGRVYDGDIDDFIVFNYALTGSDASALYESYSDDLDYLEWISGYPDLADTLPTGDPDGDGLQTGIEYVLDSDPTAPDNGNEPVMIENDGGSSYSYVRKEDATAFSTTQIVMIGSDLTNWYRLYVDDPAYPASVEIVPLEDRTERVMITPDPEMLSAEGLDTSSKLFFRLMVEF